MQLFSLAINNSLDKQIPSALDVYRGKTELKINKTYENDSIIVALLMVGTYLLKH